MQVLSDVAISMAFFGYVAVSTVVMAAWIHPNVSALGARRR